MADQNLRYRVTADTTGFVQGMQQVQKISARTNKSVRNNGQAFTQLAYALDDAQYGFRGVQNNLQAIAVTAGLSGPVVLGITALTVGLGYLIEKTDFFKASVSKARKELEKLTKVLQSNDEQIIENANIAVEYDKKTLKSLQAKLDNNKELLYINNRGQAVYRELSKEQQESIQTEISLLNTEIEKNQKLADLAQTRINRAKRLKEIRESEDISDFEIAPPDADNPYGKQNIYSLFGINPNDPVVVDPNDILVLDEADLELFGDFEDMVPEFEDKGQELGQALQSGLQGAIAGTAEAIGSALAGDGNFGEKFLQVIGKFMVGFGTAMIAIGVAKLKLDSLLAIPGTAPAIIAAGAALAVVGSAIAAGSASKKSGYGGSSGGGNIGTLSPSVTPSVTQGVGQGGGLVATIRGQDLRFINQAAADSYNARN